MLSKFAKKRKHAGLNALSHVKIGSETKGKGRNQKVRPISSKADIEDRCRSRQSRRGDRFREGRDPARQTADPD
jgi:hypothetical protein